MMPPPDQGVIKLWAWDDAPDKYKALSLNGGDEDWVMHIPQGFIETWGEPDDDDTYPDIDFTSVRLDLMTRQMGVCSVDYFRLDGGSCIVIGAHA
jgi:hypothetical protein